MYNTRTTTAKYQHLDSTLGLSAESPSADARRKGGLELRGLLVLLFVGFVLLRLLRAAVQLAAHPASRARNSKPCMLEKPPKIEPVGEMTLPVGPTAYH